ncbi:MAG: NADH-quinone oxidoreductase subunit H [Actinomycetota bacterium]|nr:NADH-quinone oxidoreductase subunit H [Actinomycetota bacterium]
MWLTLKRVLYMLLTLGINLYICSYLISKIPARAESRRGFTLTKAGSIGYPYFKLLKYLSKESRIGIWDIILFLLSLLLWSFVPLTSHIFILDIDSGFLIALFFLWAMLAVQVLAANSRHSRISENIFRQAAMAASLLIPAAVSFLSVIMVNQTMDLKELVNQQYDYWNIVQQPLGFLVVLIAAVLLLKVLGLTRKGSALSSRSIEVEGSGLPLAIHRFSKYMIVFCIIVLMNIFFLGGWLDLHLIDGNLFLIVKFYIMLGIIMLVDKAMPEIDSYKYIVDINWKFLVPVSLFNFGLTLAFLIIRNIYGWI